ncbi:hypothetical protein [Thalassococcus sp. S3]|uniref:hypothetical protein n=1 Tax=Thalassococcus sp. S3 TaxID=2017482 RepID=UPI0010248AC0|nr:hypothetical protein [Thalassococcus sp. S3]QBF29662.1 hypothetical protein CFI11_00330 [Thalassococcus sp. S3]
MSSVDAPAVVRPDLGMRAEAPSALQTLGRILTLAIPFAVGAAVTSALNLGKIAMLARVPDTGALHILSLLQPSFILILAIMEGLAITNQVFSARSRHNWPARGVLRASRQLSIVGLVIFAVVAGIGYGLSEYAPINDPTIQTTLQYFPLFVLSMGLFVIFDIYYGAMRGQGKVLLGLLPFAALVVIDLSVTYALVTQLGWGFEAVLLGNLAGPALMLPVMIWLLRRETAKGEEVEAEPFRIRLRQLQVRVGLPVFSSIVVGFVSASVVFPLLAKLGQDNASAFFVVLRYRIAFMIPAIAIGSAIAILVNQATEEGQGRTRVRYLAIGVPIMLVLYAAATFALPKWSAPLDVLVPSQSETLRLATEFMFAKLLITFFLVAATAMYQVILEQLGRGVHVLVITIICEAGTCAAMIWAMQNGADITLVVQILVGFAALSFALFSLQFLLLMRKMGAQDAV